MGKHKNLILDIIKTSMKHMTAEEIFMRAKQMQSSIAVGTIYRNLGLMTESGEIRRISMTNAPDRYDKSLHPHEHIVCNICGEFSDIFVSDLKGYLEKETGIEILEYDLNLKHICNKCKEGKVNVQDVEQ